MAALRSWQRLFSSVLRNHGSVRSFSSRRVISTKGMKYLLASATGFGSLAVYQAFCRKNNWTTLPAVQAAKDEDEDESPGKTKETNYREMRFRQFASVEYDGNIYMTPQDFLESVTEESPRVKLESLSVDTIAL
ncbi:calcium uptake protein 3, mitochondrial [Elysia marginata]|uniref:Calcium uptake protein 3, mitochondrial n=1 Tax=Elysia marginata TaxID=1093978 RepID=A0AAV4EX68_9GAST|nr:calcium uptake protein 3, mitochondrial [Elysia marginata]